MGLKSILLLILWDLSGEMVYLVGSRRYKLDTPLRTAQDVSAVTHHVPWRKRRVVNASSPAHRVKLPHHTSKITNFHAYT